MSLDELNFVTFCVDNLSRLLGWSSAKVYGCLRDTGILSTYILPSYDVLHTFSKDYLMNDLLDYMKKKGVAV